MGAHRSPATVFRKISISIPPVRAGGAEGGGEGRARRGKVKGDGKKEELPAASGRSSIPHPLFYPT